MAEGPADGAVMGAMAVVVLLWAPPPDVHRNPASGLRTLEVGRGRVPFVLLHGYGGTAGEWIPFSSGIQLSSDARLVFPEAPEATVPPEGPVGGRAWWRLDLRSYRRGTGLPDLSAARPAGLDRSTAKVLPFDVAARLERRMREAGLEVTWVPFEGGHFIPDEVVVALNRFLAQLGGRR